jgi:NADH dehydrogenase
MAGQITELARRTLPKEFRSIDPRTTRVVLADLADAVLGSFGDRLSEKAARHLQEIGVEVRLGEKVVAVDQAGITLEDRSGTRTHIPSSCKIWAAGVAASPLARQLAEQCGVEVDRAGRIPVQEDLTLPGHPEVHVVGDMASLKGYPGVAQVAIQGGKHSAKAIKTGESKPFHYRDKGSMATVSRFNAVASVKNLRLSGFIAWLMWLGVHVIYLVGFKNRVTTVLHWAVSFVGRGRSERVATEQQVMARGALQLQTKGKAKAKSP